MHELSTTELRGVQLELLVEFDRICRRHQLTYYLAYGSLLGAVRHGGYIPWDDDIDVMMPRADYERLHEVFTSAAPAHLSLGSAINRTDWPFPYGKIGDDRTELLEPLEDPLPLAVNLDVFPLDPLPSGRLAGQIQGQLLRLLSWALELRYVTAAHGRNWHHPLTVTLGKPLLGLLPTATLEAAVTRVAHAGARATGDRIGVRVGWYDWSVPTEALGSPVDITFEGLTMQGPADPDAVLSAIYGDYRQLPPQAEQTSHHAFTATWRTPS